MQPRRNIFHNSWNLIICGSVLDLFKGLSLVISNTEPTSAQHSVTCDVSSEWTQPTAALNWGYSVLIVFVLSLYCLWEWDLLDNCRNIVCVLNFVCVVVYVVCMFVCLYVWERLYFMWSLVVVLAQDHLPKFSSLILWDCFFPKYI